ncbi:MAG: hypothetical protein ACFHU9_01395 [Fluviicola sp.]
MKFTLKIGLIALMSASTLVGCQKYEDGPMLSLTPRTERVANTWKITYAEQNGEDVSNDYEQYELYLTTDGEAQLDAVYSAFGSEFTTSTEGIWMFTNDEENILFDFEDDSQDDTYEILRLKNEELWLHDLDRDLELRLIPK